MFEDETESDVYRALLRGDLEEMRRLLVAGADPNEQAPLSRAVHESRADMVSLLLERGADVNQVGEDRCPPVYWAAWGGKLEILKILLEAGGRVDLATEENETPLHAAADNAHLAVIELLLQRQAPLEVFDTLFDHTPLHHAVRSGSPDAVRLLLAAGADPDALSHITNHNTIGNPPLRKAVKAGNVAIVRLLMEAGADPDRPGWMWNTARDDAEKADEEIRQLLEVPKFKRPAQTPHRAEVDRQLLADAKHYGIHCKELDWSGCAPSGPRLQFRGQPLEPARRLVLRDGTRHHLATGTFDVLALTVEKDFRAFWTELTAPDKSVILAPSGIPSHVFKALTQEQQSWLVMDGRNQRWRADLDRLRSSV